MGTYLMIESRDPFTSGDVSDHLATVEGLAKKGNNVTLFLVQNGVLPARQSTKSEELTRLSKLGVKVLADEFSLRERGVSEQRLAQGVESAPLDVVIDHLAEGSKTIWH